MHTNKYKTRRYRRKKGYRIFDELLPVKGAGALVTDLFETITPEDILWEQEVDGLCMDIPGQMEE